MHPQVCWPVLFLQERIVKVVPNAHVGQMGSSCKTKYWNVVAGKRGACEI